VLHTGMAKQKNTAHDERVGAGGCECKVKGACGDGH
jgi:hypothetical protein